MLLTKQQIIDYLTTNNFTAQYVCGDGTLCEMFTRRILPEKVFAQTSMGPGLPARHWWIEHLSEDNKFVLRCSYFAVDETPITREEFIVLMKNSPYWTDIRVDNLPASLYTPSAVIEWLPTAEGEWTATYNTPTPTSAYMIAGALSKILTKPRAEFLGLPIVGVQCGSGCYVYTYNNAGPGIDECSTNQGTMVFYSNCDNISTYSKPSCEVLTGCYAYADAGLTIPVSNLYVHNTRGCILTSDASGLITATCCTGIC